MPNLAFDTHQFVIDLTKANMPEAQAEALARHYANLLNDRLATKDDLHLQGLAFKEDMVVLRAELKQDMSELRAEFKEDMASLEHKMDGEFAAVRGEIARLDQKIDRLDERLSAKIINTALKTQIAGVVVICTIMGLMFTYFMP